ncbi:hypothetical protein BASA81_009091 [Batrachochytrium salamandrivorans]|nr:hypothetical protein BASA81_009091 [Batrachochytrium salamandrivorans]
MPLTSSSLGTDGHNFQHKMADKHSLLQPRAKRHQSEALVRKSHQDDLRVEPERVGVPEQGPNEMMDTNTLKRNGIPQIIADFRSTAGLGRSPAMTLRAVMATRKLFGEEDEFSSLSKQMIQLGLVNDLCMVLDSSSCRLQFEAVWGITNAMFADAKVVAQSGAMGKICRLLDSASTPLREQCMWSLGNFMSKGVRYRNLVLECDPLLPTKLCNLLTVAYEMTDEMHYQLPQPRDDDLKLPGVVSVAISRSNYLRQATWALAGLLRGGDTPSHVVQQLLSSSAMLGLEDLVLTSDLPHTVANALWFLADLAETQSRFVLQMGLCDRIIELGMHSYASAQAASSQCISNLCAGDEHSLRALLMLRRADLVLINHLQSERKELHQNASWTLSYACSKLDRLCTRLGSDLVTIELLWTLACDMQTKSEIRQDAITTLAFVLKSDVLQQHEQIATISLLGLVHLLRGNAGLERDLNLLERALQLALAILQRAGKPFLYAFEEREGLAQLHAMECETNLPSVLANLLELVVGLYAADRGEEEEEEDGETEEQNWQHLPGVRFASESKGHRQGYQNYNRD